MVLTIFAILTIFLSFNILYYFKLNLDMSIGKPKKINNNNQTNDELAAEWMTQANKDTIKSRITNSSNQSLVQTSDTSIAE
jgi:hypothetical protein